MNNVADEFKLTCDLRKAYEKHTEDGKTVKFISGLATGPSVDLEYEQISKSVLQSFQKAITDGMYLRSGEHSLIPLRSGHRQEWDDILGYIVKAELDEQYNLWITAELEPDNPNAELLYKRLTQPKRDGRPVQLGLSVGGKVVSAGHEYNETTKSMVRTFYDVALKEISVVGQPAYPTAFVQAMEKSVNWEAINGKTQLLDEIDIQEFIYKESTMADQKEVVTEPQVEEVVTKTEEPVVEEVVAKAEANDESTELTKSEEITNVDVEMFKSLESKVDSLTESLTTLANAVNTIVQKSVTEEVEEVQEAVIEKAEEVKEEVTEVVEKAVAQAPVSEDLLKSLVSSIGEMLDVRLKPFEQRLTEIEEMPIDKSLSIDNEKSHVGDEALVTEEATLAKFREMLTQIDGKNAIAAALQTGQRA